MSEIAATGDGRVDAALAELDRLDELPPEEHLPLLESAHGVLRAALTGDVEAGCEEAGAGTAIGPEQTADGR